MKKKDRSPELETFTLLNPDFTLPTEESNVEPSQENPLSEGNISENLPYEE